MTTSKRIDIGSLGPLIKDIGQLYTFYFDHGYYVQNEIKAFIKEFEIKRGDTDINALGQALDALQSAVGACDNAMKLGDANLYEYFTKVRGAIDKTHETLRKEEQWKERRQKIREVKMQEEDKECSEFLIQLSEAKKNIDLNVMERKKQLEEEYKTKDKKNKK